jgi:hypothetical protein
MTQPGRASGFRPQALFRPESVVLVVSGTSA